MPWACSAPWSGLLRRAGAVRAGRGCWRGPRPPGSICAGRCPQHGLVSSAVAVLTSGPGSHRRQPPCRAAPNGPLVPAGLGLWKLRLRQACCLNGTAVLGIRPRPRPRHGGAAARRLDRPVAERTARRAGARPGTRCRWAAARALVAGLTVGRCGAACASPGVRTSTYGTSSTPVDAGHLGSYRLTISGGQAARRNSADAEHQRGTLRLSNGSIAPRRVRASAAKTAPPAAGNGARRCWRHHPGGATALRSRHSIG